MSILSRSVTGVSVLYEWMNKIQPKSAEFIRQAFLQSSGLSSKKTIAILSPKKTISKRESQLLYQFVTQGGKLILSFHDSFSLENLFFLRKEFDLESLVKDTPQFTNGSALSLSPQKTDLFFEKNRSYAFYSFLVLESTEECTKKKLSCYFTHKQVGKGYVILLAGFPFFSNGLIGLKENPSATLKLIEWAKKISFDEYHHFYSDVSFKELLFNPSFILPILGMCLLLILFFLFGYTKFHWRHLEPKSYRTKSMHQWNEGIVASNLTRFTFQGALSFHQACLEKILQREKQKNSLPKIKENLRSKKEVIRIASEMLFLHQNLLNRKRKVQKK